MTVKWNHQATRSAIWGPAIATATPIRAGRQNGGLRARKRSMLPCGEMIEFDDMTKSEAPVTIKRYAERRLYRPGTGSHVTLRDLAAMVEDEEDFVVYD